MDQIIYDEANMRIVAFEGAEFWTWDWINSAWVYTGTTLNFPGEGQVAYDAINSQIILVKSVDAYGENPSIQTWALEEGTWILVNEEVFQPYFGQLNYSYSIVQIDNNLMRVGGLENATWMSQGGIAIWTGSSWQGASSISERSYTNLGYDKSRDKVVIYGGQYVFGNTTTNLYDTLEVTLSITPTTRIMWQPMSQHPPTKPRNVHWFGQGVAGNSSMVLANDSAHERRNNQWFELYARSTPIVDDVHISVSDTQILMMGWNSNKYKAYLWNGSRDEWWSPLTMTLPTPRSNAELAFDKKRSVWILFGGRTASQRLDDLWEFDGQTWTQVTLNGGPSARDDALMVYDPNREVMVLFGGNDIYGAQNDVWEWDGNTWTLIRASISGDHYPNNLSFGIYDEQREVFIVNDTENVWEWDGRYWIKHDVQGDMGDIDGLFFDYNNQNVLFFRNQELYRYVLLNNPIDNIPISTISRVQPRDARQNSDTIRFDGLGADGDATDIITAYRWMNGNRLLSTQAVFTTTAAIFDLGAHTITLEVQDNEGNWSAPVAQTIYIRDDSGSTGPTNDTWTLLLYVAADNNLDPYLGTSQTLNGMLYRLQSALPQPNVKVALLYDGPDANDTYRYVLNENSNWSAEHVGEAQMDNPATLEQFITWGYDTFFTDYYALAMIDHANGVVGFGQDLTSDISGNAFLTPSEIRSALQGALDDGARTLDVVHFDGCSFGLLENAAIVDGLAQYVIASPNTGWGIFAYDVYRQKASTAATPREYALDVAAEYAVGVQIAGLPYTISVQDMEQFATANDAISHFGTTLLAYIDETDTVTRRTIVRELRDASQKYDSGGIKRLEIDVEDSYVDIVDFAQRIQTLSDPTLTQAAQQVETAVSTGSSPFIIYEAHQSGLFDYYDPILGQIRPFNVDLDNANGLPVFYPPRYSLDQSTAYYNYITHQLFNNTRDSGWTEFLAQGLPPQLVIDPPPLPSDFLIEPLVSVGETGSPIVVSIVPTITSGTVGIPITVTIDVQSLDGMFDGASFALDFDPTVLQVEAVNPSMDLDQLLLNEFDNTMGTVDVAVGTLGEPVTGTFTVASIRFVPQVETTGTPLNLVQANERQTGVTFDGQFLPIELRSGAVLVTASAVTAKVNLQGRPAPPDASWSVPLHIRFYDPSTTDLLYEFETSTNTMGEAILPGVAPGVYEVTVKNLQTLQNRLPVTVTIGSNLLDLGILRAGDANDDNLIILDDFSVLRSTFDLCAGSPDYDGRADFNGNGCVQLTDFSLLAMNFGSAGQLRQAQDNLNALDVPTPFASLVVIPETQAVASGDLVTVTIAVDTNQAVDGAAAYLKFDPNLLELKTLSPGTQLPLNLTQKVDGEAGIISFAAGTLQNFPSASFTLVTLTFEAKEASGLSTLKLATEMPYMSDVTAQGYSVLLETFDGEIQVQAGMDMYELFLPAITRP